MKWTRRGFVAAAAGTALGGKVSDVTATAATRSSVAAPSPATMPPTTAARGALPVIELRQYTLRANQRDTLIELFEERFIEPQNELGAHIVGTFRDLDDPDRFVWIRGFPDMATRQRSLEAFYGGPVWHANREAANATILDSDNVLMLRPVSSHLGFAADSGNARDPGHMIGASIHYLASADAQQFATFFSQSMLPHLIAMGVRPIAQLITHDAANNFRLPIREHETVFIWFARWHAAEQEQDCARRWSALSGWRDGVPEALLPALMRKPERLRLSPTARSALR